MRHVAASIGIAGTCLAGGFASGALAQQEPGTWLEIEEPMPSGFTDLFFAAVPATQDITPNGQDSSAEFHIGCTEGRTYAGVTFDTKVAQRDVPITIALDLRPPTQEAWVTGQWQGLIVAVYDEPAIAFVKRLISTDRLTLQLAPHGRTATYTFEMKDIEGPAGAVAERCGWTLN